MRGMRSLGLLVSSRFLLPFIVLLGAGGCADECSFDVDCPGTQACVDGTCQDRTPTRRDAGAGEDGGPEPEDGGPGDDGGPIERLENVVVRTRSTLTTSGGMEVEARALTVAYDDGSGEPPMMRDDVECTTESAGVCSLTLCSPIPPMDAGMPDAGMDAGFDAGFDAGVMEDAGPFDAGIDAGYDAGPPPILGAGDVSATYSEPENSRRTVALVAEVQDDGSYIVVDPSSDSAYWPPESPVGELVVRVQGGEDVPVPATTRMSVPGTVTVEMPEAGAVERARGADLSLTLETALNVGLTRVSLSSSNADGDFGSAFCDFPAGAGTLTIPASVLDDLQELTGSPVAASASSSNRKLLSLSSLVALDIEAASNVRGSNGENFAISVREPPMDAGVAADAGPDAGVPAM